MTNEERGDEDFCELDYRCDKFKKAEMMDEAEKLIRRLFYWAPPFVIEKVRKALADARRTDRTNISAVYDCRGSSRLEKAGQRGEVMLKIFESVYLVKQGENRGITISDTMPNGGEAMTNENLPELKPDEMDAEVWAMHFLKKFPNGGYDKGDLLAWFAGMIMAGHDTATWREQKKTADARRAALESAAMICDEEYKRIEDVSTNTGPYGEAKARADSIQRCCLRLAHAIRQRASEG